MSGAVSMSTIHSQERIPAAIRRFTIDITDFIEVGKNTLRICVQDKSDTSYHGRGKQMLKNGGMFYTAQSGLWQTVWCEWVPETYIQELRITPDYDRDCAVVEITSNKYMENREGAGLDAVSCKILLFDQKSGCAGAKDFCSA